MPKIKLAGVSKKYGSNIVALDKTHLEVHDREYVCLLGPSGCGKTTLLKLVAGIIEPSEGEIFIDGKNVNRTPIEERGIGYMFQNYALFPHMNVWKNVVYGPTVRGGAGDAIEKIGREMLDMVRLLERRDAMPAELSGGMQQRVAIARALASGSKIVLLDEPLGALDARIKSQLRVYLRRLIKDLGLTAIHVTHDQEEAMIVADRIILIRRGKVVQDGRPDELYFSPKSPFVANFVGDCNFFECVVSGRGEAEIKQLGIKLKFQNSERTKSLKTGSNVILGVRPEDVLLGEGPLSGRIESVSFAGPLAKYEVKLESGETLKAVSPNIGKMKPEGEHTTVGFDSRRVLAFDYPEGGLQKELEL